MILQKMHCFSRIAFQLVSGEQAILKPNDISFSSLYSGCGGLDLGFVDAGFKAHKSFDIDATALKTLQSNVHSEICATDLSIHNDSIIDEVSKSDILIAGPPCQGFSTAGKNNPDDIRNNHLSNVANIAGRAKPKIVIIENVRGLLSKKNSAHFEATLSILRNSGYRVTWDIHNTADYGIAQKRNRVLILAVLSDKFFEIKLKCKERLSLSDALYGIDKINDGIKKPLPVNNDDYLIAKRIKPGQKLSNVRSGLSSVHTWEIPEVFGIVTDEEISFLETIVKLRRQNRRRPTGDADPVSLDLLRKIFGVRTSKLKASLLKKSYIRKIDNYIDITNTFNGKYRRLVWEDAAPTVDTRFGQPRYFLHPEEQRGFSVREAAR